METLNHKTLQADILEHAPSVIAFMDTRQNLVWANKAYRDATNCSLEEFKGQKCYVVRGLQKPCNFCPVIRALETGKPAEAELTPDMQDHWQQSQGSWLSRAVPLRDDLGMIIGVVQTAFEISERKQAELEKLRESESRYRGIFEQASEAILLLNGQGFIIDCNPVTCSMLACNQQEILGHHLTDLVSDNEHQTCQIKLKEVSDHGYARLELVMCSSNGQIHFTEGNLTRLHNGHLLAMVRDITKRKLAEQRLESAEREKRDILDSLMEHVIHQDRDMKIIWANRAARESAGMDLDDLIGRHCFEIWPQQSDPCPDCPVIQAMHSKHPVEREKSTPDGRTWFIRGYPMRDVTNAITGCVEITLEITKRKQAEQNREQLLKDLAGREALLWAIFENAPEGIVVCDQQGRITMTNPAADALYKRPVPYGQDIESQKELCCLYPDGTPYAPHDLPLVRSALNGEICRYEEILIEWPQSQRRWLMTNTSPIRDPEMNIFGAVGVLQDITPIKNLEQALQESEEKFSKAFYNSPSLMVISEVDDGTYIDVNQAYCDLTGYSREELLGKSSFELGIVSLPERRQRIDQLRKIGHIRNQEQQRYTKSGETKTIIFSSEFIELAGYIRLISTGMDITDRKRAEQALKDNERLFRTVLDNSLDGIHMIDFQTHQFLFISPALETLTGFSYEELKQLTPEKAEQRVHPEDRSQVRAYLKEVIEGKEVGHPIEYRWMVKNGEYRWFSDSRKAITNDSGRAIALVGVSRDVTDQKELNERLRAAKEAAESANQAKSRFVSNMSHEIRTPLNGVKGMIELADRRSGNPEVKHYLDLARQSAEHLMCIINDVIDLSKMEAGHIKLNPQTFSLPEILEATFLPLHTTAAEKDVVFKANLDERVPKILIGDTNRLRQVLENVVGNAVKFTFQGSVTVHVDLDHENQSDNEVRLLFSVTDTGIGIPDDQQSAIFDRFSQVESSAHAQYHGSGLGLALCKRYLEMMDGNIWCTSREGHGSTFYFSAVFTVGSRDDLQTSLHNSTETSERPLKVLVAEDSRMNQLFTEELLKDNGHTVVIAEDGHEALQALSRETFDLVLMDIRMPNLNGEEALHLIRNDPPHGVNPHIPVVALTAHALKDDQDHFLKQGFNGYLPKPIDIQNFEQVIHNVQMQTQITTRMHRG